MRRLTLLFVGAVVVPSALLLALGVYAIRQDEELVQKRRLDDRLRASSLVRQDLLNHLEDIALRAARRQLTPRNREVALVARLQAGRLVMPWDDLHWARRNDVVFDSAFRDVQQQLYGLRDPAAARARLAVLKAHSNADRARAELLSVVCLAAGGDRAASRDAARRLLDLDPSVTDEYGVPFAFYAAGRLFPGASGPDELRTLDTVAAAFDTTWVSPAAAYMAVDLLSALRARASPEARERSGALDAFARRYARELGRLADLSAELPLLEKAAERIWILPRDSPWMLGLSGAAGDPERMLIAIRPPEILAGIRLPEGMRWSVGGAPEGEGLGERLRGVRLAGEPVPHQDRTGWRRLFYVSALFVVLSVAGFSAWLLNRDVRRDRRLAALRSQFVSSVSHELRTPISTIRTCAELLDMGRAQDERQRSDYLKAIIGESERLNRLVSGVLSFARIEQGARVYDFRTVSLREVLDAARRELAYQLSQKGFQVRTSIDAGDHSVRGDAEALQEAVVNLLTNAMKYSRDRRQIEIGLRRDGRRVVISVRDYGIGIAPEHHARIFERFYRAPPGDAGEIPGAGLGLTIVEQVVKAHGGQVSVESRPGAGSTFSVSLPGCEVA